MNDFTTTKTKEELAAEKLVDYDSEAVVLATLVKHPRFYLQCDTLLKPSNFYSVDNKCIYWAVGDLVQTNHVEEITTDMILEKLKSDVSVRLGYRPVDRRTIDDIVDYAHYKAVHSVEAYKIPAMNVYTLAYKRGMRNAARKIIECCEDKKSTQIEISRTSRTEIDKASENYMIDSDIELYGESVDQLTTEIMSGQDVGYKSKITRLNEYMTYEKNSLTLIAGRMKAGKSAFCMNECLNMLKQDIKVLYIDTEMDTKHFHNRALANLTGIPINKIKTNDLTLEEHEKIAKANEWFKSKIFIHKYMPVVSDEEIYSLVRLMQSRYGIEILIYDYIKSNTISSSEQYNERGRRADFLKNVIGGDLNLPVIAGVQLNRDGNVADSDKLQRYCTGLIVWQETPLDVRINDYRNADYGNYRLQVKLNRNGEQIEQDQWINALYIKPCMQIVQAKLQSMDAKSMDVFDTPYRT